MTEQWQELKETITEMRDNDGTGTQQEVCKFLVNYMDVLEKQMQGLDVFDKIRAEIEAIDTVKVKLGDCMNIIKSPQRIKDEVLEIIDKYMGVRE